MDATRLVSRTVAALGTAMVLLWTPVLAQGVVPCAHLYGAGTLFVVEYGGGDPTLIQGTVPFQAFGGRLPGGPPNSESNAEVTIVPFPGSDTPLPGSPPAWSYSSCGGTYLFPWTSDRPRCRKTLDCLEIQTYCDAAIVEIPQEEWEIEDPDALGQYEIFIREEVADTNKMWDTGRININGTLVDRPDPDEGGPGDYIVAEIGGKICLTRGLR